MERLDAPRFPLPRPRVWSVLRWAAVCALLLLAAGVLYRGAPAPTPAEGPPGPDPAALPRRCAPPPDTPPAGTVGFPLRLPDPAPLAVVKPGHRVDVLIAATTSTAAHGPPRGDPTATANDGDPGRSGPADVDGAGAAHGSRSPPDGAGPASVQDVQVLRTVTGGTLTADPGGVLYLAVTPAQAAVLARVAPDTHVSVTVRPPR